MKLLNSRKNRNRFGRQLLAVFFTLGIAGSPFGQTTAAAELSPGCQKEFEELSNQCVNSMKGNDAFGTVSVAKVSSAGGCPAGEVPRPGWNEGSGPRCAPSINASAEQEKKAAEIGRSANANVSADCTQTLAQCEKICGSAMANHEQASREFQKIGKTGPAGLELDWAGVAKSNIARCKKDMGMVATGAGISATTLGLAAAAAGGIFLLTKSGSKDGDSSGGDTTTPDDPTSVDPISTDPDSGFQTYEDMYKYWITNKCRSVLSGTISASEDIVDNCTAISKDPSFSTTLASLGTCSDVDNYGRPDCFDRINNYCLQIASEKRSGDPTCAGFCVAKPQADSCTYAVGVMTPSGTGTIQPIDQNPTTDPTSSSSGSPFNTVTSGSYYPRVQQAPSGTPGYISATQTQTGLSMSPRIGVPTSGTRTLASASAGQPDCSSAQMMNKPECEAPMAKYCSQYGSQGKGCPEFCKTHKNVCKK